MRKIIRGMTVVAVALCALTAGVTGADARTPGIAWNYDGIFRIHNSFNDRCLDADESTPGLNGTKVQLWNCGDNTDTNQLWRVYESTDNVYEKFQNVQTSQYLDADTNTIDHNGTKVQLWSKFDVVNQMWRKDCSAYCTFATADFRGENRILDADSNTIGGNGTKVQLWQDLGGSNQHWYFELVQAP